MTTEPVIRCGWPTDDPMYLAYHDEEWGVPSRDDTHLFEMLCLEGQQAGLSWITVLKKRARYRERFFGFDVDRVAQAFVHPAQLGLGGGEGGVEDVEAGGGGAQGLDRDVRAHGREGQAPVAELAEAPEGLEVAAGGRRGGAVAALGVGGRRRPGLPG